MTEIQRDLASDIVNLASARLPEGFKPDARTIPMVVDPIPGRERAWDIYSRLLESGIIVLDDQVDHQSASLVTAQMQYLAANYPERPIELHLNSPGGDVTAGLAIYDVMQYVQPPVRVVVRGQAASMGAIILAGGSDGERLALPNARILLHEVRTQGMGGTNSVMKAHQQEMDRLNDLLAGIISERTGQPLERVKRDFQNETFLSAEEAKEYGIVDAVITPRKK